MKDLEKRRLRNQSPEVDTSDRILDAREAVLVQIGLLGLVGTEFEKAASDLFGRLQTALAEGEASEFVAQIVPETDRDLVRRSLAQATLPGCLDETSCDLEVAVEISERLGLSG